MLSWLWQVQQYFSHEHFASGLSHCKQMYVLALPALELIG